METALFQRTLVELQNMHDSDKKEIKAQLLQTHNDLTQEEVDNVFNENEYIIEPKN